METDPRKSGSGMSKLPAGLSSHRLVEVEGGRPIDVREWSAAKLIGMNEMISDAYEMINPQDAAEIASGKSSKTVGIFMRILGEKVLSVVEMSVDEKDRDRIRDLSATDFLSVLEAVVEINITPRFLGKAKSLGAKLVNAWTGSAIR